MRDDDVYGDDGKILEEYLEEASWDDDEDESIGGDPISSNIEPKFAGIVCEETPNIVIQRIDHVFTIFTTFSK